jgi:6-pyruvoyltetrahydropterin/6-carboxytetrahydropterin synthase
MERWSIQVDKQDFRFSAAHFLIFPDGSAERLHGHNYRVSVEVEAGLDEHGLVIDFQRIKPLVRALLEELDERLLLPGEHRELTVEGLDDEPAVEVRYRERRYVVPADEVRVLPICNTSTENLAALLGRALRERIARHFEGVQVDALWLAVEETPGQRGVYRFSR